MRKTRIYSWYLVLSGASVRIRPASCLFFGTFRILLYFHFHFPFFSISFIRQTATIQLLLRVQSTRTICVYNF
ncbi:hypothetical protein F5B20DRAFT_561898 [Whalleya microplaca]|nr:hypothetical protein F5B20DRAFT_561898 [Whalleya microplaca]